MAIPRQLKTHLQVLAPVLAGLNVTPTGARDNIELMMIELMMEKIASF